MCVTIAPPTLPQRIYTAAATEEYLNNHRTMEAHSSSGKTEEIKFDLLDYFFLDPLFIIGVLVAFVIIVIIISWYLDKRKLEKEAAAEGKEKHKDAELGELNPEVLTSLLSLEEKEVKKKKKWVNSKFRCSAKIQEATTMAAAPVAITELRSGDACCEYDEEEEDDGTEIMTIMPQKAFRDFPKSEEEIMAMRRENLMTVLSLPPL